MSSDLREDSSGGYLLGSRKYRKKPIVIEAQQWWPPGDERHDPSMLTHRKGGSANPPDYRQAGDIYCFGGSIELAERVAGHAIFMIHTLEGPLKVSPGDWIITGVQGEKYPCKPDIFDATYEAVE